MYPTVENECVDRLDAFVDLQTFQSTIFVGGVNTADVGTDSLLKRKGSNPWSPHIFCTPGDEDIFQRSYVVAPATSIPVLQYDEETETVESECAEGTSLATPLVSTVTSLLIEAYNRELIDLYVKKNPSFSSFVAPLQNFNVRDHEGVEKVHYDMTLGYLFKALTSSSEVVAWNSLADVDLDRRLLNRFKTQRSRFVTRSILEGARKTSLLDETILLDPTIYGQGVVDADSSYRLLKEKFEDDDAIHFLQNYEVPSLTEEEYERFIQRQEKRVEDWVEAHPEYTICDSLIEEEI